MDQVLLEKSSSRSPQYHGVATWVQADMTCYHDAFVLVLRFIVNCDRIHRVSLNSDTSMQVITIEH